MPIRLTSKASSVGSSSSLEVWGRRMRSISRLLSSTLKSPNSYSSWSGKKNSKDWDFLWWKTLWRRMSSKNSLRSWRYRSRSCSTRSLRGVTLNRFWRDRSSRRRSLSTKRMMKRRMETISRYSPGETTRNHYQATLLRQATTAKSHCSAIWLLTGAFSPNLRWPSSTRRLVKAGFF